MNKIMMAAAVAVVAMGAFATPCEIGPAPTIDPNASVYAWKFTGKTTVGYPVKNVIKGSGSVCVLGEDTVTTCAIRIPGSLAIQGYTYICDNCCDGFKDTNGHTGPDAFYMTKPFKSAVAADIVIDVAHVIGKKATQYEVEGQAKFTVAEPSETYTVAFAGLGSYSQKWPSLSSVSGNFAGKLESPYYVKSGVCAPADYWNCKTLDFAGDASAASVAYGTWSVKLNTSAAKKYRQYGTQVKLPSWYVAPAK